MRYMNHAFYSFCRRGIPAQPILNGYCGDYEWTNKKTASEPQQEVNGQDMGSRVNILMTIWCIVLISSHLLW